MWSVFNMPKNKKEYMGAFVGIIIAAALFFGIGWSLKTILYQPLIITIGEREIKPGDTRLSELLEDGYLIASNKSGTYSSEKKRDVYEEFYDPQTELKDNTLLWGTVLVKGDEALAYVNVSTGGHTKKLKDCTVLDIILYEPLINAENCTIDGIPAKEATVENITEKRGEFKEQSGPNSQDKTKTTWTKGGYELTIETDPSLKITEIIAKDKRIIT